ncbi:hypothetical protein NPIL_505731 [Nephila pilipes]|uniref:Uncharacterized protein n=1 Tax=Nephila pilipes TaxID=299642 RepID=A0A8X6TRG4_NEPPI|nr:hypothetical protein NPIL_505731 [Nephila pilipes]
MLTKLLCINSTLTTAFIILSRLIILIAEEPMSVFERLSSDCSDTPIERSSDEDMSIDDPPATSSSGFQKAEGVDGN